MKIADTPDNASRLAHMLLLDQQIQERYNTHTPNTRPDLRRWFLQPIDSVQAETLDFKEQWIQMVDSAHRYYN
jgi:hypothetical protein